MHLGAGPVHWPVILHVNVAKPTSVVPGEQENVAVVLEIAFDGFGANSIVRLSLVSNTGHS